MGCVQSTPGDKEKVKGQDKMQTSLLAPTLHYSIKYVPQACKITNYKREDIETLYKLILSPFQVKSVPFSNGRFLDPDVPYEPIDGGFDSNFENLQAELLSASKTWPLNTSDSIFVFLNEGKSIRLKALITGAESTPYAHGLFEFDLAFNNYPLLPPKVNFLTTGNNKVAFGPLLCKTGKVRLPILGMTYGCEKEELWTKEKGVSEILFALHELVKTNNLCENELNLETLKVDEDIRRRMNKGCGNVVKCCTIQYAMLYHLRNPAPWLRDFIHTYFYLKKDIILKECHKWLVAAQDDDALYDTFGSLYNPELSAKIANGNYHRKLQKLVWNLEKELAKIKIHIDPPFLDSLGPTQNETQTEEEKEDKGDKEDNNQEENKGDLSYKTQMSEF